MLSQHSSLCSRYFCSLAPSLVDLHALSQVANTSACVLFRSCSKWLVQKKTPKNVPAKKKAGSGQGPAQTQQMPWAAQGWTNQQWTSWKKRRQPATSSHKATINPSWWAEKGSSLSLGDGRFGRFVTSRSTLSFWSENFLFLGKLHTTLVCMAWSD